MFYTKNLKFRHTKDMYDFIQNHFKYWTDLSTNSIPTIANNVKIYNLDLKGSREIALQIALSDDIFNMIIENYVNIFEDAHPNYNVFFNGRSGGYLILCSAYGEERHSVIPAAIRFTSDYKEFKQYVKRNSYYDLLDDYGNMVLKPIVQAIRDFDKLCDQLVEILDQMIIEEEKNLNSDRVITYAVIHSSICDANFYSDPDSYSWTKDLEIALSMYEKEEPYGYDFDEVRLVRIDDRDVDGNIETKVTCLKYKGGISEAELIQMKYNN